MQRSRDGVIFHLGSAAVAYSHAHTSTVTLHVAVKAERRVILKFFYDLPLVPFK